VIETGAMRSNQLSRGELILSQCARIPPVPRSIIFQVLDDPVVAIQNRDPELQDPAPPYRHPSRKRNGKAWKCLPQKSMCFAIESKSLDPVISRSATVEKDFPPPRVSTLSVV
jgi:hypothetical protein